MHSRSRRARGAGLAITVVIVGALGLVAALSTGGDGDGSPAQPAATAPNDGAPAARRAGPTDAAAALARYRQDADFERLAVAQAQRWVASADRPEAIAAGLSPARCGEDQVGEAVFLLPAAVGGPGEEPGEAAIDCTVDSGQRILADLGSLIATEDANGIEGGYDLAEGTRVPFAPAHLEAICADVLDQGLQPAPTDVTLDGEPVDGVRAIVSGVFPVAVAAGSPMAADAAALGHPDHVQAAHCGYKLLLEPLPAGPHTLRATVMGNRSITWRLQVVDAA